MLGRHSEVVDVAEVLLEESSVTTRDDVDDVLGVSGEDGKSPEQLLGGDGGAGILDNGSQGAVYREEASSVTARTEELNTTHHSRIARDACQQPCSER